MVEAAAGNDVPKERAGLEIGSDAGQATRIQLSYRCIARAIALNVSNKQAVAAAAAAGDLVTQAKMNGPVW